MSYPSRMGSTAAAALAAALIAGAGATAAEQDCALAARYQALADTALAEHREEDAYQFSARAVETCDEFAYWQQFGELGTRFGDPERDGAAAAAFVKARELAGAPAEAARAIAAYAEVLFHSGDRSRAVDYVFEARNLDPDNAAILELAERMQSETEVLTEEDVRRGRAAVLFQPMPLYGRRGRAAVVFQPMPARKVNVPLTFEYGTTELDEPSRRNVSTLSSTLASFGDDQQFVFEGHADRRGEAGYNRDLSLRRAGAVRDLVVGLEPALAGRIFIVGKGEDEPRALGDLESDHRANRRIEVKFL